MDILQDTTKLINKMTLLISNNENEELMNTISQFVDLMGFANANIAIKHRVSQIILQFMLTLVSHGEAKPIKKDIYRCYVCIRDGSKNELYLSVKGYHLIFNFNNGTTIDFKTDFEGIKKNNTYPLVEDGQIYFSTLIPNEIKCNNVGFSYTSIYDEKGIEVSRLFNFNDENEKMNASIYRSKSDSSIINLVLNDETNFDSVITYISALGFPQQKYTHELEFDLKSLKDILSRNKNIIMILPGEDAQLFPTPFSRQIENNVSQTFKYQDRSNNSELAQNRFII